MNRVLSGLPATKAHLQPMHVLNYTFSDLVISSGTYDSPKSTGDFVNESTIVSEILDEESKGNCT